MSKKNTDDLAPLPDVVIDEQTKHVVKAVPETVHPDNDELAVLIKKNIQWSQVLYQQNKKIEQKLLLMTISGYIRLAIILVPIIIGAIYLPPLLKDLFSQYDSLLQATTSLQNPVLSPQIQELIDLIKR